MQLHANIKICYTLIDQFVILSLSPYFEDISPLIFTQQREQSSSKKAKASRITRKTHSAATRASFTELPLKCSTENPLPVSPSL